MDFYLKVFKKIDFILVIAVGLIIVLSLFVLASATKHLEGDHVQRQLIAVFIGLVAILVILRLDYSNISKYAKYIYFFNLAILLAVLIFGKEIKGAKAWIVLPFFGSIQPAEFSKLLLIIAYADFLNRRRENLETIWELLPAFAYILPPLALIMLQPDLGTGLVLIAVMIGMLFVAGANPLWLAGIFGGGSLAGVGYILGHLKFGWWMPLKGYQLNRILVLFDPTIDPRGVGWNVLQSKIAVGNGGLWGQGIGQGTQSLGQFLPEQWTDFAFAVFAEEMGFVGTALIIVLFFIILSRSLKIARTARDMNGALIATGIVSMYLFHILENIGMNIGLMPVTGIPLPFISYGGTAMIVNLMAIGVLLNIQIRRNKLMF